MHYSSVLLLIGSVLSVTRALPSTPEQGKLHLKGIFSDNGHEFALYSRNAETTGEEAFAAYMKSTENDRAIEQAALGERELDDIENLPYYAPANDTLVAKRGYDAPCGYDPLVAKRYPWINCTKLEDGHSIAGCSKRREDAPNQYYNARGFQGTKEDLLEMWDEAFRGGHLQFRPRTICRQAGRNDQYSLCITWSELTPAAAPTKAQLADMVEYAMECQGTRGMLASQIWADWLKPAPKKPDMKLHEKRMLCISGRAKKCYRGAWHCKDLWYADEHWDQLDRNMALSPETHNEKRPGIASMAGPCVRNCGELRGQDPIPPEAHVEVPPIPYENRAVYGPLKCRNINMFPGT